MLIKYADICDKGLKRSINQDSTYCYSDIQRNIHLFCVADGMGGHEHGEIASGLITEGLKEWCDNFHAVNYDYEFRRMVLDMQHRIAEANRIIYEKYNQEAVCGSTCVVLLIYRDKYAVVSAGDSHIYLYKGWHLKSLMTDDTWENQSHIREQLSRAQIHSHPHYGKLVNAIGTSPEVSLNMKADSVGAGDIFLLCSDGLYKYCDFAKIKKAMKKLRRTNNPDDIVKSLLDDVYEGGADDNVSIILVKCLADR